MIRRIAAAIVLAVTASLLTACSGPSGSVAPDDAATHEQYGMPAVPAPDGFRYQSDVVVGGGRNAVLGGSADGLTWDLDANAPAMDRVKVGGVVWATAYVVGRVAEMRRTGSIVRLTLLPVPLTDLIRDGRLSTKVDLASSDALTLTRASDGWSGPTSTASAKPAAFIDAPAKAIVGVAAKKTPAWQAPAPGINYGQDATYGGVDFSYTWAPDGVNVTVAKNSSSVKATVDFGIRWNRPRFVSTTSIVNGKVVSNSTSLAGLQSVTATMTGGAASPASSIPRFRVELPWTMVVPIGAAAGIPIVGQAKITFTFGASFDGANATIAAAGDWKLQGSVGGSKPVFAVKKSLIESISGISLGPSAIVAGVSLRVLVGAGVPGLTVGPYSKLSIVAGIANGSALGASLVRCRAATLDINAAVGAAYEVSDQVSEILRATKVGSAWLKDLGVATSGWAEVSNSIVTKNQTIPDVPLCQAS